MTDKPHLICIIAYIFKVLYVNCIVLHNEIILLIMPGNEKEKTNKLFLSPSKLKNYCRSTSAYIGL